MNKIYLNVNFEDFKDLFYYICKELNHIDGMDSDDEGDTDFYNWVEGTLSNETKEAMVNGELSGLTSDIYAKVIDDSYIHCQAYPNADFNDVFRQRCGIQKQADDMARVKRL